MTIYFNEMPTQRNARTGYRNGETAITYVRKAKPNSKIKKLRIRLINYENASFDPELLRLHPNGDTEPESALDNSRQ